MKKWLVTLLVAAAVTVGVPPQLATALGVLVDSVTDTVLGREAVEASAAQVEKSDLSSRLRAICFLSDQKSDNSPAACVEHGSN